MNWDIEYDIIVHTTLWLLMSQQSNTPCCVPILRGVRVIESCCYGEWCSEFKIRKVHSTQKQVFGMMDSLSSVHLTQCLYGMLSVCGIVSSNTMQELLVIHVLIVIAWFTAPNAKVDAYNMPWEKRHHSIHLTTVITPPIIPWYDTNLVYCYKTSKLSIFLQALKLPPRYSNRVQEVHHGDTRGDKSRHEILTLINLKDIES